MTVEGVFGIDLVFVVPKRLQVFIGQKFELGDADAVFARNHAAERAGELHDAFDRTVGGLKHLGVV